MKDIKHELYSEVNLNTLVQSIYKESIEMGFKAGDYVKLMNELLELTITSKTGSPTLTVIKPSETTQNDDLPISTKNLNIRYYDEKLDKDTVSKWFNEENNKLFFLSVSKRNNLNIKSLKSDDRNIFATITLKNNKRIGLLAILNIDRDNNKGEMRKMIGEIGERGKGYAKESSEIWLKYCTDFLGLNKIYINTIDTNIKNITLNRQLGLKIEGLLRKEVNINKVTHDVLRMAYFK